MMKGKRSRSKDRGYGLQGNLPNVQDGRQRAQFIENFLARRRIDIDVRNRAPSRCVPSHLPLRDVDSLCPGGSPLADHSRDIAVGKDQAGQRRASIR